MDKKTIDNAFDLDCNWTSDSLSGGRFIKEIAEYIAKQDKSVLRHNGVVKADYRDRSQKQ